MNTTMKIMLAAVITTNSIAAAAEPAWITPEHKAVKAQFMDPVKEPTAKDALWTIPGVFKVGVIPDGTDRSMYAGYVCEVLYDHGFKGQKVIVKIIDIVKLVSVGKWETIGEYDCL